MCSPWFKQPYPNFNDNAGYADFIYVMYFREY